MSEYIPEVGAFKIMATCVQETGQKEKLSANIAAYDHNETIAICSNMLVILRLNRAQRIKEAEAATIPNHTHDGYDEAAMLVATCMQKTGRQKLILNNITDDDRYVMIASCRHIRKYPAPWRTTAPSVMIHFTMQPSASRDTMQA